MAKVKLPGLLPMVTPPMSGKVLRLEFRLRRERGECRSLCTIFVKDILAQMRHHTFYEMQ
jgi:hypothetical protein